MEVGSQTSDWHAVGCYVYVCFLSASLHAYPLAPRCSQHNANPRVAAPSRAGAGTDGTSRVMVVSDVPRDAHPVTLTP